MMSMTRAQGPATASCAELSLFGFLVHHRDSCNTSICVFHLLLPLFNEVSKHLRSQASFSQHKSSEGQQQITYAPWLQVFLLSRLNFLEQIADAIGSGSGNVNIESTNIKTAPGVSLDEHQKTLVGSVLDVRGLCVAAHPGD